MSGEALTEADRSAIEYLARHLIAGRDGEESSTPDPHAADSIDLAWDGFEALRRKWAASAAPPTSGLTEALAEVREGHPMRKAFTPDMEHVARRFCACGIDLPRTNWRETHERHVVAKQAEVVAEHVAQERDRGVRQAIDWLRAGYEYGTGPEWRENAAEWIAECATTDRLARADREREAQP